MSPTLIIAPDLIDSFVQMLPKQERAKAPFTDTSGLTGPVFESELPQDIKDLLPEIFKPNALMGYRVLNLYNGDSSEYGDDASAGDLALVSHCAREGLTASQTDLLIRSSLRYRSKWDEMRGAVTYGQRTINLIYSKLPYGSAGAAQPPGSSGSRTWCDPLAIQRYQPTFRPGGMAPRGFAGPNISQSIRLFPLAALSTLVALGGVGKTSVLIALLVHIAAGKSWAGYKVQARKAAAFFCEETQDELDRKFSATTEFWSPAERQLAIDNCLFVSLLGQDARLTANERGQYQGTGIAEQMIAMLEAFGLIDGLVVLDHMQGFASGDLNISETATAICREANKIVDATGAAVVFAAHIAKANINAQELAQGFASGSLAFENATRQMSGMLPMSEDVAKQYGLDAVRRDYVQLGLAKNSYGATDDVIWLHKRVSPSYHTVVMEPTVLQLPLPTAIKSASQKVCDSILVYIANHPFVTKNRLEIESGSDGLLKVSKARVRDTLKVLIEDGLVEEVAITAADRAKAAIPKQVTTILRLRLPVKSAKTQVRHGRHKHGPAGLEPAQDKA